MKKIIFTFLILTTIYAGCKKTKDAPIQEVNIPLILEDYAYKLLLPNLQRLSDRSNELSQVVSQFILNPNDTLLKETQNKWYQARLEWEQSEAALIGPAATLGLDPAMDSWPVNFIEIDSVLKSSNVFSDVYIDSLSNTLKGFHCIEYLIFGLNKSRKASDLTSRQLEFLNALARHLDKTTTKLFSEWSPNHNNYVANFKNINSNSNIYKTKKEALLEITNALIGIIDEVANGKIQEAFAAQDSMLEESPFAQNSWEDFTNNIIGVKNIYTGLNDPNINSLQIFVQSYNKSLHTQIIQDLDFCITSLSSFKEPFGRSIYHSPSAVSSVQSQLNELNNKLENELIPLINLRVID